MARIIQPPRTGKTVIAAHMILGTGLTATIIVPSRMLIEQTVNELRTWLGNIPIGMFYGDRKEVLENGVNVVTYAILQAHMKTNTVPEAIRNSALVIADEGHQTMTRGRQEVLLSAFESQAVRIALTATPDYSEDKALAKFFPDLIHEITFDEAIDMDLLAPYRFWLGEVDVNGSAVRLHCGDFVDEDVARITSEAPFFKAVEMFRYATQNRSLGALVCCTTRQQAKELCGYLKAHRPKGTKPPCLVLGTTPERERTEILDAFEAREVDTIVSVKVLVQGWNSPRCKLLIDLAMTLSRVLATQKFSRPLTRDGDNEARIIAFVPKDLPVMPLLPLELFGSSLTSYRAGELIGTSCKSSKSQDAAADRLSRTPIKDVDLKSRILFTQTQEQHRLEKSDFASIRQVLISNPEFNPALPPKYTHFRWVMFRHELFQGRGFQLLRYLGYQPSTHGYIRLLSETFPEGATLRFLLRHNGYKDEYTLRDQPIDAETYQLWLEQKDGRPEYEELLEYSIIYGKIREIMETIPPIEQRVICWRCGLDDEPEQTLEQIGAHYGLSRERIRNIESDGFLKIRQRIDILGQRETSNKRIRSIHGDQKSKGLAAVGRNETRSRNIPSLDDQIYAYGPERYARLVRECYRGNMLPLRQD
ncbi:MAG: sigma factor-like helix-turn-helix DNA-binding protein [Patescibacteria group bacterium]|nr:sigma factor-like helix-turn-helix DNA-binding protein [Patescibacteria group bacterium]